MARQGLFSRMLSDALYTIKMVENRNLGVIQDELGYVLGRKGGSVIERWRKGYLPPSSDDIEKLAHQLIARSQGQLDNEWLKDFLHAAGHPQPTRALHATLTAVSKQQANGARATPALGANGSRQTGKTFIAPDTVPFDGPFVAGPPVLHPRCFYGREREVRQIALRLRRRPLQHIAVIGPRRSGKTSLLHYLAQVNRVPLSELRSDQHPDRLMPQHQWVFVDFQDSQMLRPSSLFSYLLEQLRLPLPRQVDSGAFMKLLAESVDRPTVLLFDKIEAALAAPELDMSFWWNLRSLVTNQTRGNIGIIATSSRAPMEIATDYGKPSPFFNIFGYMAALGPLSEASARALVNSAPEPFPPSDVDWILEQSGRWPALLQILCSTRLYAHEAGGQNVEWRQEALQQISTLWPGAPSP